MNRQSRLILGLLLTTMLVSIGCTSRVQPAQVVARVNGVELTETDLDAEMRHTRAFYLAQYGIDLEDPENDEIATQAHQEALERIIDQELVRQIAEGLFPPPPEGEEPTPVVTISSAEVEARAQQYEEQAGNREELLQQNGFLSYSEFLEFVRGELRVEKLFQRYGKAEQVHARHILVSTEEEANQVLTRLRAGEDFAKLAQELSLDQGSAANGGDLDWFGRGKMVAPFEEAVFALEPGQVSEPVETQFGFHIIQLLEKDTRPDPQAFQAWFDEIKAQADIKRIPPNSEPES